jgi:hypothetical protein
MNHAVQKYSNAVQSPSGKTSIDPRSVVKYKEDPILHCQSMAKYRNKAADKEPVRKVIR